MARTRRRARAAAAPQTNASQNLDLPVVSGIYSACSLAGFLVQRALRLAVRRAARLQRPRHSKGAVTRQLVRQARPSLLSQHPFLFRRPLYNPPMETERFQSIRCRDGKVGLALHHSPQRRRLLAPSTSFSFLSPCAAQPTRDGYCIAVDTDDDTWEGIFQDGQPDGR